MCILWVLSLVNPAQYTLWVQSLVLRWEYPRSYFFPPPTSFSLATILAEQCTHHRRQAGKRSHCHKTQGCRAAWQGSSPGGPHPAALRPVPLPSEVSRFVSTGASSDGPFPSGRQEPTHGRWKGFPFLKQACEHQNSMDVKLSQGDK